MHRILGLTLCFLLLFTASVAAAAEVKIAVFDVQDVAVKSDVLKQGQAAMRKSFNARRDQLDNERKTVEKKVQDAVRSGNAQQINDAEKQQKAYAAKAEAFVAEVMKADERVRLDVDTVIIRAAESFGKKKGYAIVMDKNAAIWKDPAFQVTDVTNDLLSETNAMWKSMTK